MRIALAMAVLPGCSYLFGTAPPANPATAVECDSYALPVVDGVVATGLGVASVAALASHSNNTCNPNDNNQDFCVSGNLGPVLGVALLVPTIVYLVSAYHGASVVGACRDVSAKQVRAAKPWNPDER
jgi:hypothetical protein